MHVLHKKETNNLTYLKSSRGELYLNERQQKSNNEKGVNTRSFRQTFELRIWEQRRSSRKRPIIVLLTQNKLSLLNRSPSSRVPKSTLAQKEQAPVCNCVHHYSITEKPMKLNYRKKGSILTKQETIRFRRRHKSADVQQGINRLNEFVGAKHVASDLTNWNGKEHEQKSAINQRKSRCVAFPWKRNAVF